MTAEPIRLGDLSLGSDSDDDDAASRSSESGPEEYDIDIDAKAREDAGARAMSAIRDNNTARFVDAMRDLLPFIKD